MLINNRQTGEFSDCVETGLVQQLDCITIWLLLPRRPHIVSTVGSTTCYSTKLFIWPALSSLFVIVVSAFSTIDAIIPCVETKVEPIGK